MSFIISQNNNIPRIKGCIERLCERFGGFPGAGTIAKHGPKGLDGLGLGYRQDYIIDAAIAYHGDGDGSTERILRSLTYEEAMRYLTTWRGIGPKVANCICLYGLGHPAQRNERRAVYPRTGKGRGGHRRNAQGAGGGPFRGGIGGGKAS